MKLSFLPADLHLTKENDGTYLIIMGTTEILRTRAEKKALTRFNTLRKELESQFPAHELTAKEKLAAVTRLVDEYKFTKMRKEMKPVKREKPSGTRTFG